MRLPLTLREAIKIDLVTVPSNASPVIMFTGGIPSHLGEDSAVADVTESSISSAGGRHAVYNKPCPLRGYVAFNLPKQRSFSKIQVVFVGEIHVSSAQPFGHPTTQAATKEDLRYSVDLLENRDKSFDSGSHRLDFAVLLPPSTAPSFSCQYGAQTYTVHAVAEDEYGLVSESKRREAQLVSVTPSADTNDFIVNVTGAPESLGSFSARSRGYPPTVGGFTLFQFKLSPPVLGSTLLGMTLTLIQTHHVARVIRKEREPPEFLLNDTSTVDHTFTLLKIWNTKKGFQTGADFPIFAKKPAPFQEGDVVEFEEIFRLPQHHELLPSTPHFLLPLPLSLSHTVQLDIQIRTADGRTKTLTYKRPVYLLSCRCSADTIVSPPYALLDPILTAPSQGQKVECACTHGQGCYTLQNSSNEQTELSPEAQRLLDKLSQPLSPDSAGPSA